MWMLVFFTNYKYFLEFFFYSGPRYNIPTCIFVLPLLWLLYSPFASVPRSNVTPALPFHGPCTNPYRNESGKKQSSLQISLDISR